MSYADLRNLAFGVLADLAGFFPRRGDVIQINQAFRPMTRRAHLDPERYWLETGSKWLVISCRWEVVGEGAFPSTQGVMVLTSYSGRGNGMLEVYWQPGEPGARGFLQPGCAGTFGSNSYLPLARYMRRLIKARRMTMRP